MHTKCLLMLAAAAATSASGCQDPRVTRWVGRPAWQYAELHAGSAMNEYRNLHDKNDLDRFVVLRFDYRDGRSLTCYGVAVVDDPHSDAFVLELPTIFEGLRMREHFATNFRALPGAAMWGRAFPALLVRLKHARPDLIWCRCSDVGGRATVLVWRCWPKREDLLAVRIPPSRSKDITALWAHPSVNRDPKGSETWADIGLIIAGGYRVNSGDRYYVNVLDDATLDTSTLPEWLMPAPASALTTRPIGGAN